MKIIQIFLTGFLSNEISFLKLLTLIFITLKICKVIAWSWWWVLSPLWLVHAICLPIYLICVIFINFTK